MSDVVLTVSGDRASIEADVDPSVPLGWMLVEWAAACSSRPAQELVMVSGNARQRFDPNATPASLGLVHGAVVRLMTAREVTELTEAKVTSDPVGPPATPRPASAEHVLSKPPAWASPGGGTQPWMAPPAPGQPAASGRNPSVPGPWPPERHAPTQGAWSPGGAPPERPPVPSPGPPAEQEWHAPSGFEPGPPADFRNTDEELPERVSSLRRFGRALKAVFSRRAAQAPQGGQFAKASVPKAGKRYRDAIQANDRAHNLDRMIREAPLSRCVVIAVVSPKGGAGKTTVSALLGMLFAELRRDPVLALDANPDFGNLKDKLGRPGEAAITTDELAAWLAEDAAVTPAELAARLGTGPHGVRFVPSPVGDLDRMVKAADVDLYRQLLARLRDYEGIIVVDCGTGLLDPPVRAALETADQIVLITDSAADTAGLVVAAANHLPRTPTWLVANKMPSRGSTVDLRRVQAAIRQLRGVTIIPEQRLTENIVTPQFSWDDAPPAWQEPVREIAARLANNWQSLR